MLKVRKKTNNLMHIAQSYTLLYTLIIRLRLKYYICSHDTFLELKNR